MKCIITKKSTHFKFLIHSVLHIVVIKTFVWSSEFYKQYHTQTLAGIIIVDVRFLLVVVAKVEHVVRELVIGIASSVTVSIAIVFIVPSHKLICHFHSKHLLAATTITEEIERS